MGPALAAIAASALRRRLCPFSSFSSFSFSSSFSSSSRATAATPATAAIMRVPSPSGLLLCGMAAASSVAAPSSSAFVLPRTGSAATRRGAAAAWRRTASSSRPLSANASSWMDRSFPDGGGGGGGGRGRGRGGGSRRPSSPRDGRGGGGRDGGDRGGEEEEEGGGGRGRNFRDDFRGTRVFVQHIPDRADWRVLKDHFAVAGEVVFASVSRDRVTGRSKGCGVVQFETTDMARTAIRIMRDHPLDGTALYVRPDYQERPEDGTRTLGPRGAGPLPPPSRRERERNRAMAPTEWMPAEEIDLAEMDAPERAAILSLVGARDDARRRRDYGASDSMREELRDVHSVHVDDRLRRWWKSVDGGVPQSIAELKGEGRWGRAKPWTQIPTTPENDSRVDPDLVDGLLRRRDNARRERDFFTADALLEQAREAPGGGLQLRIHDESRTWRIWTEERPEFRADAAPPPMDRRMRRPEPEPEPEPEWERLEQDGPREDCLALVRANAPEKMEEVTMILDKFPGREDKILSKLRERYGA